MATKAEKDLEKSEVETAQVLETMRMEFDKKIEEMQNTADVATEQVIVLETASDLAQEEHAAVLTELEQLRAKLDEADNRFRNLNSSLGKSGEMDTVEACKEATKEVAERLLYERRLITYLGDVGLLEDDVHPQEAAMNAIEMLRGKVAKLESEHA